ncbi:hypothetical protein DJ010_21115 [Nocardioides silvaticus]|uniref:Gram-positive cocci surface proteins LPxTG domain-containing protein n=1 Tax=Nocardioides silvaticus TaxID=2201891 RepID=A0A316T9P9_9ACTN|nr:hypothetical protein DJ010_21115 [Nocardioides silvaticus]
MFVRSTILRRSAAALLAAVGSLSLAQPVAGATAPAAAACRGSTGVTAFVDFAELGGGVTGGCDQDGGDRSAAEVFRDAGYTLEYSQQPGMNGYVCKVQGKPADGDCASNDSFWSLWWSDGESGRWVFSNRGVGSLEVPDGGYVAWAWHEGAGQAAPPAVVPTPRQDSGPNDDNGGNGNGNGNGNNGDGGSGDDVSGDGPGDEATSPAPSATSTTAATDGTTSSAKKSGAGMSKGRKSRATQASDPTSDTSDSALPGAAEITAGPPPSGDLATDDPGEDGSAVPTWIGIGLAAAVLGAAGVVTVLRRRAG